MIIVCILFHAYVEKNNNTGKRLYIPHGYHMDPISVHINATFRFINRDKFSEAKVVHVNIATVDQTLY